MTQHEVSQHDSFSESNGGAHEAFRGAVHLLRVAEYRQGTILWTLAACCALGIAYYALAPRYFRSQAKVMVVEQRGSHVAGIADQAGADELMTTHKELVRSPVVVRRAIDQLQPQHRIDLIDEPPERWIETVSDRLRASTTRKTNLITVGYESRHPEAASAVVQAIIEAYLGFVAENHRGSAADVLDQLIVERGELEANLAEKQEHLRGEHERMGHLALPQDQGVVDPVIDRAIQLNTALMESQRQRVTLQASLATIRAAIANGRDVTQFVGAVQDSVGERVMLAAMGLGESDLVVIAEQQKHVLELKAELSRIRPFYGAAHPKVAAIQAQIADTNAFLANYHQSRPGSAGGMPSSELGPLMESMLLQAIAQATEQERQLAVAFEDARAIAAKQSGDLVSLAMLEREVERLESLHDILFQKIAAVDIHQVQAPIRATIVEEPLPDDEPSSPQLRFVLAASLLGGLGMGFAIAYIQDLADDRFGSPDEMAAQLGCRVLAVVRKLTPLAGKGIDAVHMHVAAQATDSEAFRTLRTSIALGSDGVDRLVVSSAEPGDGKTTISANLAMSYAQSNKRTLVVDADLRKPGLTALFDLKGRPGLTDVLSASGPIRPVVESCLVHTENEHLDVIPAGPRRPDPAELLLSPNLGELLAWADGRYDQVLVDCPPVLAVSDAQIVGRSVDGVVLVVSPDKNHRRLVSRAVDSFYEAGVNLLGVVANRVSEQSGRGYGYGYGYGYGEEDATHDAAQVTPAKRAA